MNASAIIEVLSRRLPAEVSAGLEAAEARDGMPTMYAAIAGLPEVCLALRDAPELRFAFCADITAVDYHPRTPRTFGLPGESGIATLGMMVDTLVAGGHATAHDGLIARKLAAVLCGGVSGHTHEVTEDELLELEREAFLSLCGEPKSQERMQYMLMNNKPLRN